MTRQTCTRCAAPATHLILVWDWQGEAAVPYCPHHAREFEEGGWEVADMRPFQKQMESENDQG